MSSAVEIGIFMVPSAEDPGATLRQGLVADETGLDYVAVQDHPYQRRFFDTWTLLSYLGGKTTSIRLLTDVINLPLRLPSMIAKSAASLDVLTGGRVELGIGAGSFWDAVEAMGGPRRTAKESVDALEEAIPIIRQFWAADRALRQEGVHYRVKGAKPGPPPAHPIGLWVGAYGPRMLRLTGRLGDGWLPSLGSYMGPDDALRMQGVVDEAARAAGREPGDVERAVNVMALAGEPGSWPDRLARIASELRFTTLFVGTPDDGDPVGFVRRLGEDVAPRVRERL